MKTFRTRIPQIIAVVILGLFPGLVVAQQTGAPATWFEKNAAWSLASAVIPADDAAKLTATADESGRILFLAEGKADLPQLHSTGYLGDCVVHFEYMLAANTHAGIYLQGRYRIQLDGADAGQLGTMVTEDDAPAALSTVPPRQKISSAPGTWQTLDARLRIARFDEARNKTQDALIIEVKINGQIAQTNTIATGWCRGSEFHWNDSGGLTTLAVDAGSLAIREFSLRRADFSAVELPKANGQPNNSAKLVDYVKQGEDLFRSLGCIECHAIQSGDVSQKTGPNLFGLFALDPRDREIAAGEGHRFTIKADRAYLHRSVRTPADELAIAEYGPTKGQPYLPAMPTFLPTVLSDAQIDAIGAFLGTLNEARNQGPITYLVRDTGLENYDPMTDRLQLLVDKTVRMQRGPMERVSGRAIHVGLPNGINYSFDPRVLAIAQIWQGGFLDMTGEFLNRGGKGLAHGYDSHEIGLGAASILLAPLNAAGKPIDFSFKDSIFKDRETVREALYSVRDHLDRLAEIDAQFLGYTRNSADPLAAPAFRYRVGRNIVSVRTEISADGQVRMVLDGEIAAAQSFLVNEGALGPVKVSVGKIQDGHWVLPAGSYQDATATGHLAVAPKSWHATPSKFAFQSQTLVTEPSQPELPRGYVAETYLGPKDNYGRDQLFEALGLAVARDGTVVISTRTAGIWRLVKGEWHQFAEGLFDSLGVQIEDDHGLVVVAGQKAELTRISDTNGDGIADRYDTLTDAFSYNGNYHAYMHGPVRDTQGDYIITLNLDDSSADEVEYRAGGKYMGTGGGYRGWAIHVPARGGFEPWADGMRSPASLGLAPDGRMWYADNQGEYVSTSKLFVLKKGAFYGHPAGLVDLPGMTPNSPAISWESVQNQREQAVVLFPQNRLANSPGNPAWDTTNGRFGPFGGQMFLGDQTQSNLLRVTTERVGNVEQGEAIVFASKLESGVMRPLFLPDGSMLLGQTGRGWQAKGGRVASLQHISWDGKTVGPAIHHTSAASDGFDLSLTVPVPAGVADADLAGAAAVRSWTYRDAPDYGSPELDDHEEVISGVTVNADRTTLHVKLAKTEQPKIHPQQTARVYQITLSGKKIWNEAGPGLEAFYTLYRFADPVK